MEKINNIPSSPWDFFFLPVWVHRKLSVRFMGLIPAIFFVGFFDMVFYDNILEMGYFTGEPSKIIFRFIVFLLCSFILGAVDVICTMVPIAEFAIMIGKRSEKYVSKAMPVILMKSYALSNILFIVPTALYVYSGIDWTSVSPASSYEVRVLFSVVVTLMLLVPYLQFGILYRTLSVRTKLEKFSKAVLVLSAYFWMQITREVTYFIGGNMHSFIKSLI